MLRLTQAEFDIFQSKNKRRTKSAIPVKTPAVSPHAVALAYFAKHPDKAPANREHIEQCRIFHYYETHNEEVYEFLHATPNGGRRDKATGGKMKAEGLKKGYPDMSLDLPRGAYHGLRIELKHEGSSKPKPEQIEWLNRLSKAGYYCALCIGAEQAKAIINKYISLKQNEQIDEFLNEKLWKEL